MKDELQKWADPAMFAAEPIQAEEGPKVYVLWMTPDPLGAAAAMNAMYVGKVKRSLADVTRAEREALLPDMDATVLKAPAEAIKFHFLIEGVTRAFTHQMVRQRTAVFAQESMRFAVVGEEGDIPVQMPPSLNGTMSYEEWYKLNRDKNWNPEEMDPAQSARLTWDASIKKMRAAYSELVNLGIPAEDARGLLPTNVLTRIHYVTDLRSLQAVAGVRLSTQAQFEWKAVIAGMARAIREYNPYAAIADSLQGNTPWPDMSAQLLSAGEADRWQYKAISDLFRPICYKTGKCEFMSNADRACTIRDRVQANHAIGRPSSEWDKDLPAQDPSDYIYPHSHSGIQAIHPAEWLADPTAAR